LGEIDETGAMLKRIDQPLGDRRRKRCLTDATCPATVGVKSASEALRFPAVQLLVERAAIDLTDEDASIVVDICRRLDGIPLAIELAAATIELFGIRNLADRLDHRFSVLTQGRRTALPRHRTNAGHVGLEL
jgi:predicted ATPase